MQSNISKEKVCIEEHRFSLREMLQTHGKIDANRRSSDPPFRAEECDRLAAFGPERVHLDALALAGELNPNTVDEFGGLERFGEIIVDASFKSRDLVGDFGPER